MLSPAHHTVRFRADCPPPTPLAWGQLAFWDVLRWLPEGDDSPNLYRWLAVPAGTRPEQVRAALRVLMERHQALRSHYFEQDGTATQRVLAEGELRVAVHEATGPDLAAEAQGLGERLRRGATDHAHDLPIRAAVLNRDGAPAAVVLTISHLAVDAWSFRIVLRDLATLLAADAPADHVLPARARQPAERARYERSEAGARREAATLAHWERRLRVVSPTMLEKSPRSLATGRDWASVDSPAMARALRLLAARTGVTPGTSLVALLGLLLAFRTGEPEAALRLIVATRFAPEDRDYVGAFNQNAMLHLTVADQPLERYLRGAVTTVLAAHRRCEADPRRVERLVADIAAERGFTPDSYCFFNDVSFHGDRPPRTEGRPADAGAEHDPEAVTAALPLTRLEQLPRQDPQKGAKLFLSLHRLDETCLITLSLDPAFLGRHRAVDLLGDLERLLVLAVTDPDRRIGALRRSFADPDAAPDRPEAPAPPPPSHRSTQQPKGTK
ncbi:condensation domain-containing protein [Kitasatospora sp. NPDC057015]|uniref:condensation domain-containing protein n=1 Tax=Kitasatospora sp. NPDC057015 TaxID=3346001 RepID=UPI0036335273